MINSYRLIAGIEYNGTNYHGFQRQYSDIMPLPTIQEKLENAISHIANHPVTVVTAGRTDAGVHAKDQIIHFDTWAIRKDKIWLSGINALLPKDISVKFIQKAPDNFHARFSAIARQYQYIILNAPTRSALWHQKALLYKIKLDHQSMQKAANYFLGNQDFSSFRAKDCQSKSPVRTVHYFNITRENDFILCEVQANAFLHHMVRNMVGALLEVGAGKKKTSWIKQVLALKNRKFSGITAPPEGLYLTKVIYPDRT